MSSRLKPWWPYVKAALALAILVAVGRHLAPDLRNPELYRRPPEAGWLLLSGVLYLAGLGLSAAFWFRLLRALGQGPTALAVARGYFAGHLGKYLPGKAWALLLRAGLVRGPAVRTGVAVLTSFYEVLTTMASGALLALALLALLMPDRAGGLDLAALAGLFRREADSAAVLDRRVLCLFALGILLPLLVPVLPPVFNRLADRLTRPFKKADTQPLPRVGAAALAEGLALTAVGWSLVGASFWAALRAVTRQPLDLSADLWGRLTAFVSLAYVAGFVFLVPGGLGVREFLLALFLVPELGPALAGGEDEARPLVVLTVVVVRLVWTFAELAMAGALYLVPAPAAPRPSP